MYACSKWLGNGHTLHTHYCVPHNKHNGVLLQTNNQSEKSRRFVAIPKITENLSRPQMQNGMSGQPNISLNVVHHARLTNLFFKYSTHTLHTHVVMLYSIPAVILCQFSYTLYSLQNEVSTDTTMVLQPTTFPLHITSFPPFHSINSLLSPIFLCILSSLNTNYTMSPCHCHTDITVGLRANPNTLRVLCVCCNRVICRIEFISIREYSPHATNCRSINLFRSSIRSRLSARDITSHVLCLSNDGLVRVPTIPPLLGAENRMIVVLSIGPLILSALFSGTKRVERPNSVDVTCSELLFP